MVKCPLVRVGPDCERLRRIPAMLAAPSDTTAMILQRISDCKLAISVPTVFVNHSMVCFSPGLSTSATRDFPMDRPSKETFVSVDQPSTLSVQWQPASSLARSPRHSEYTWSTRADAMRRLDGRLAGGTWSAANMLLTCGDSIQLNGRLLANIALAILAMGSCTVKRGRATALAEALLQELVCFLILAATGEATNPHFRQMAFLWPFASVVYV